MRKLLIALALISVIFVSGCAGDSATGSMILDEKTTQITYMEGSCRQNTDCLLAHCDKVKDYYCMNSIQVETKMKCYQSGTKMVAEKDYEACGCFNGYCSSQ